MKKEITAILISLLFVCSILSGCGLGDLEQADSSVQESIAQESSAQESIDPYTGLTYYESASGISLYMGEGFAEESFEGVTCAFNGPNNGLSCRKETFEELASVGYSGEISLEEYAQLLVDAYQLEGEPLTDEYGNVYFTYEQDVQGTSVTYFAFIDKGSDSFWTSNFVCITAEKELYEADFHLWASSIEIQ